MHIRPERREDAPTIHALTASAFEGRPFSDGAEPRVIDALRAAGALTLSLVATEGDEIANHEIAGPQIAGHVAFSPVTIDGEPGAWFALGPVSVWPHRQRQGVGQALIREGLRRLRAQGAGGCVLLGDPAYYRRFGFENDPRLHHAGAPAWAFQCLTLNGPRPEGEVSFHPAFDVP